MVLAANKKGAILLLASALWVVLIRTVFWGLGYDRGIVGGDTVLVVLASVYIIMAALFWLNSPRGFKVGLGLAGLSLLWVIGSGLLSGRLLLPDYAMMILQLLVVYFSLRAYWDYQRAKAKVVHPMEYPVFG